MHSLLTTVAASFASMADVFWDAELFQPATWNNLMNGLRIGLTLVGALLLIYEGRARKLGEPIPERTKKWVAIVMAGLAFGVYFDFGNPKTRYPEYYHRHEFFHYYLGSKYSKELGYTRLYECAAIAEGELRGDAAIRRRELRSLRVNLIQPVVDTEVYKNPGLCKDHFTEPRWAAFKKDVSWFYKTAAGSYWENMQKDHGYNPPPVWTMEGKFFASFGEADDGFFKLLSAIDPILQAGCVLLLYWAFGWRVMAVATIFWGCNAPANFYWTGGAFIRQDWIFFLVAAMALARKQHFVLAGAALTWSALLRVFPLIFFGGVGIVIALDVIRRFRSRKLPEKERKRRGLLDWMHPHYKQFIAGCIVAGGILIPASVVVTGPSAYKEFVEHISVHKNTPLTNHMGLETMLVHTPDGRMRFTRDDNLDDPFQMWKEGRNQRKNERMPLQLLIVAVVGGWMVWALRRTKFLWVAMPISTTLVISLTNLTCYYYCMFMIAPALLLMRPTLGPAILAASAGSQIILMRYYWIDDKYTAMSWLFYVLSLLFLFAYSRPFSVERLKAWWEGRGEPKSAKQKAKLADGREPSVAP